ncbi:MAG: hypothetical protein O6949_05610 [Chloroflexi bacterium]|nr:hypothetical protein [Chloroflexota bacterium]
MNKRSWRRFALGTSIMLAVIVGPGVVRAQAVEQAAVEDLKQTIAEQQLQISQQQQLLQMQSIILDGLQQKVVDSRQKSLRRAARKPCGICRTGRRGLIRIHP